MSNLPDNWDSYWANCVRCNQHYHMSEGCDCGDLDDDELEALLTHREVMIEDAAEARADARRERAEAEAWEPI